MGLTLPPDVLAKVLAAEARQSRRNPPWAGTSPACPASPAGSGSGGVRHHHDDDPPPAWRLAVRIPGLVVVSEANRRDHWAARRRRAKGQAAAVALALSNCPGVTLPVRVTLVRVGGRPLDSDNLAGSFKAVQDEVARFLSVDDGDTARVHWTYRQQPGGKTRGVVIVFRPRGGHTS